MQKPCKRTQMMDIMESRGMTNFTRKEIYDVFDSIEPSYHCGAGWLSERLDTTCDRHGYGDWLRSSINESRYFKLVSTNPCRYVIVHD